VDHGPSGFCSTPCYPGLCAAGFVCRDRPVSVQDGTITSPICVAAPGDNACESCRYTKCKTALETCLTDAKCAPFAACADACTSPDCLAACAASDPAGAALYKPVSACECSAKCAPACADLCASPGSGGAGGSGGSAGSGDAGQQAAGSGDAGSGDAGSGQSGKGQAGQQAAGSGDAGGAPAGGASGSEQGGASANTPPDAGSSGGCHAARGPGAGASWALLALAWLAARRRRVQPPASKASSDGATVM
jgi:MYXO-CTERM domain-containing protein